MSFTGSAPPDKASGGTQDPDRDRDQQMATVPGTKRAIVILIQVGIASLHVFRFGRLLSGEWYRLY